MSAMMKLTKARVHTFRKKVYRSYETGGRKDLPWRRTRNPYRVFVSEMMLQQTQVPRVLEKYGPFLERFPSFTALAQAPLRQMLRAWSGLGYNRRAMLMKRAAELVVSEHGGRLPAGVDELVKLPGIGPATAGAIAAFAFGQAVPFIETNIRTVFLHHFFRDRDGVHDAEIMPLVARTLDRKNPRRWYFALMDYGVALKRRERGINSRSAHYVRQGRFAGSDREARGLILRALTEKGSSERELGESTKLTAGRLRKNIASLEREGMIVRRWGKLTIV